MVWFEIHPSCSCRRGQKWFSDSVHSRAQNVGCGSTARAVLAACDALDGSYPWRMGQDFHGRVQDGWLGFVQGASWTTLASTSHGRQLWKIVRSICPFVRGILLLNLPWLAPLVSSIWISYFHWGRCFTVILKAQLGWLPSCRHGSAHGLLTIFRVGSYFLKLPPAAPRLKFSRYAFDAGDYCIVFAGDK